MKKLLLMSIAITFFLVGCKKNEFGFGETETGFIAGTVYKTNSAGLLYLEFDSSWNETSLSIYADKTSQPTTEIATVRWHGSLTQPLDKNTYWKIDYNENSKLYVENLVIKWIPIE